MNLKSNDFFLKVVKELGISFDDSEKISALASALESGLFGALGAVSKGDAGGLVSQLAELGSLNDEEKKKILDQLSKLNLLTVMVKTPIKLETDYLLNLKKEIEKATGKACEITEIIDRSLIGGVIIETNRGLRVDKSIKSIINQMVS